VLKARSTMLLLEKKRKTRKKKRLARVAVVVVVATWRGVLTLYFAVKLEGEEEEEAAKSANYNL